jgi:hypothetical protein
VSEAKPLVIRAVFEDNFLMPLSRRIIFHIGAPKTGTSAIQRFLASNIGAFRALGFDYLNGEPVSECTHTTGNGMPIFLYFASAEADPARLESLIKSYFGSERTAVVSSELLSEVSADGWKNIIDACRAADIAPDRGEASRVRE